MFRSNPLLAVLVGLLLVAGRASGQAFDLPPVPADERPFPYSQPLDLPFGEEGGDEAEDGEEEDEIETDRDSFTPATTTAGYRRLIVESAYSFLDNRTVPETHSFPELICRYGVSEWLELRLGWNYEVGGGPNTVSGGVGDEELAEEPMLETESQISYGLKALVTRRKGWLPQSALILQAGTPTSGRDTATQLFATYVFGWQFANRWQWDTAIRYGLDSTERDHFNDWVPSTVLKFPMGERWTAHIEYFGLFTEGARRERVVQYVSPGVHYLITRDLEVGIRVGWGLTHQSADSFVNAGFGWRF